MKRITLAERTDWKEKAKNDGFGFHTMYGEPYWNDGVAYVFSLAQIEKDIEDPTSELHSMCLDAVDRIVASDERLLRLAIPESMIEIVRASWKNGDKSLYGRFDLAYDGTGPAKMLEYNADTPTSIFEASYFQYNWLIDQIEAGNLPEGTDQFNSLQERLVETFTAFDKTRPFHFSCWSDNLEDRGNVTYLLDCAVQAGLDVRRVDIRYIGVDGLGRFVDQNNEPITQCFKLYPWEDMLREEFARNLKPGIFIEPLWKAILSNKGFLADLWEMNKGHPNLLETYRQENAPSITAGEWVIKPYFSREGENITILENGRPVAISKGEYDNHPKIVQERARLFRENNQHAVIGSWIIGNHAAGMGIREDEGAITKDMARFIPHVIID